MKRKLILFNDNRIIVDCDRFKVTLLFAQVIQPMAFIYCTFELSIFVSSGDKNT